AFLLRISSSTPPAAGSLAVSEGTSTGHQWRFQRGEGHAGRPEGTQKGSPIRHRRNPPVGSAPPYGGSLGASVSQLVPQAAPRPRQRGGESGSGLAAPPAPPGPNGQEGRRCMAHPRLGRRPVRRGRLLELPHEPRDAGPVGRAPSRIGQRGDGRLPPAVVSPAARPGRGLHFKGSPPRHAAAVAAPRRYGTAADPQRPSPALLDV